MGEWWTYSLSDFLMFSPNVFFYQFATYNLAVWPGQILALVLGIYIFWQFARLRGKSNQAVSVIIAICWIWVAWGYFANHHANVNIAAGYFAAAFAIQALLIFALGIWRPGLAMVNTPTRLYRVGNAFILIGVLLYPLFALLAGRSPAQGEVFALAPDPTVFASLGVLLAAPRWRGALLVIPMAWCAITGAMRFAMEAPDFWVMPAAGIFAIILVIQDTFSSRSRTIS